MTLDEAHGMHVELIGALLGGEDAYAALRRTGFACDAHACPQTAMEPCRVWAHMEWRGRVIGWYMAAPIPRRAPIRKAHADAILVGIRECRAVIDAAEWSPEMFPADEVAIAADRV